MPRVNASLILYFLSGFLYVIFASIGNEFLTLVTKPIIIPSIIFYYFTQLKRKGDDLFVISLVLFFLGDILYLINVEEYYFLGLFLFLIPYLILIFFIYKDFLLLLKVRAITKVDSSLLIIIITMIYLVYSLLTLIEYESKKEFIYILFFGIELFVMSILTALLFSYSSYRKNAYLAFTVVSFVLSDVFFMLDKQFDLIIFEIVNAIAQTISYYFYVKYFIERSSLRRRYLK